MSFFQKFNAWTRSDDVRQKLQELMFSMAAALPESGVVAQITYSDVIEYFVKHKPRDTKVAGGAMLRATHRSGIQIVQIFLDNENNIINKADGSPYGRRLLTREIDQELLEAFGKTNLVIVK